MKLSTKKEFSNNPVKMELKQTDGTSHDPQVFITMYPIDSKVGKAAQMEMFREFVQLREKNELLYEEDLIVNGMLVEKAGEPKDDIKKHYMCLTLSRLIVTWEGIEDEDGNAIPYDFETATNLFKSNEEFFVSVNALAATTGKSWSGQNKASPTTQNSSGTITERPTKTTKRAAKRADTK